MAAFTIINATMYPALMALTRGEPGSANLSGRVAVAANGKTVVPTSEVISAYASITMEDGNTYTTSTVDLTRDAQTLTAQMVVSGGTFCFEIVESTGEIPNQITLDSTCRLPVTFTLRARPDSATYMPFMKCAVVVAPQEAVAVSTAKTYAFRAIVDGITTEAVFTSPAQQDQDLQLTIAQDNIPGGDWAAYHVSLQG